MTPRLTAWAAAAVLAAASALALPATAAATPSCDSSSTGLQTVGPASPGDFSQIRFSVMLTNASDQSCTLQGYPEVVLVGPDDPAFGPNYQLPQQSGDPQLVTLAPGASARSVVTFLPGGPDDGWVPDTIQVTLPGESTPLETPWIGGLSVFRQDAATHPGTFNGPLEAYE